MKKRVGPHVSIAGGIENAPLRAVEIGATGFALFTKNQKQWKASPYKEGQAEAFMNNMISNGYTKEDVLPHAGYLINLAQPDDEKWEKSLNAMRDELSRVDQLGLKYLNVHPGAHLDQPREDGIRRVSDALDKLNSEFPSLCIVLEITAGSGSYLGSSLKELDAILSKVQMPEANGLCIDTCHAFAAGNDIKNHEGYESFMDELGSRFGFSFLKGIHANDSKNDISTHKDRHESLGKGFLGDDPFLFIMQDRRLDHTMVILETPDQELWKAETALLLSYQD